MHTILRSSLWVGRKGIHSLSEPTRVPGLLAGQLRTTTILCIRKGNQVVMMGDKRVTLGQSIIAKDSARKLRRAGSYSSVADSEKDASAENKVETFSDPSTVLVGFAGSTADAMTLLEKLEAKLNEFPAQLLRASVELAKEWRGDKMLRRLEASMIVADVNETLEIDGSGNVLTPDSSTCTNSRDEGIVAIGSGGQYAKSAARALMKFINVQEGSQSKEQGSAWSAEMICRASMEVAASIDVFTSKQFDVDRLHIPPPPVIGEETKPEESKIADGKPQETNEKPVKLEPQEKGPHKETFVEDVEPKNKGKTVNSDMKTDQKSSKPRAPAVKQEENVSKTDEKAKKTAGKNQQHKKGKEE